MDGHTLVVKKVACIMRTRVDIHAILSNPKLKEKLMVNTIVAIQSREGIDTTREQALRAYRKIVG